MRERTIPGATYCRFLLHGFFFTITPQSYHDMSFFTPINQAQEGISRSSRLETTEPAAVNEAAVNNVADQEGGFMPAPVLQTQENYAYPPCPPLSAALLAYPRRPNPNLRLDYAVDAPFPRLAGTPLVS